MKILARVAATAFALLTSASGAQAALMDFSIVVTGNQSSSPFSIGLFGTFDTEQVSRRLPNNGVVRSISSIELNVTSAEAQFILGGIQQTSLYFQSARAVLTETEVGGVTFAISFDGSSTSSLVFNVPLAAANKSILGATPVSFGDTPDAGSRPSVTVRGIPLSDPCRIEGCVSNPSGTLHCFTYEGDRAARITLTTSAAADVINPPVGSVPEPATWMMMLMGMGIVGVGLRGGRGPAQKVAC